MTVTDALGETLAEATTAEDSHSENSTNSDASDRPDESLSLDDIFHLLQNRRRRDVLRYLDEERDTVELSDLAEQVAAWEHDTTVQALSSKERKRVYVSLYQSHLPKLDDLGVIEYDQHRGRLRRTERADQLVPYLDLPGESDDADGTAPSGAGGGGRTVRAYYVGATACGGLLLSLVGSGVSVFGTLSGFHVAAAILSMFAVVTAGTLRRAE